MFNAQAKLGDNPDQNHFLGSFTSLNRILEVFNLTMAWTKQLNAVLCSIESLGKKLCPSCQRHLAELPCNILKTFHFKSIYFQ